MQVVIYEGVDGTGKSTEIDNLVKSIKEDKKSYRLIHVTGEDPNTLEWYHAQLNRALDDELDYLIYDRWAIGEFVYGNSYRDGSRISIDDLSYLIDNIKLFSGNNPVIIMSRVKSNIFEYYFKLLCQRDNITFKDTLLYKSELKIKMIEQGHFLTIADMLGEVVHYRDFRVI